MGSLIPRPAQLSVDCKQRKAGRGLGTRLGNGVEEAIVLFLFQDGTHAMAAGIGVQHKLSVEIGVGQDRWGGQELFQSGKGFLAGTL